MCTLVVAAKLVPGFPLVIVANRDEKLDRASSPPFRWEAGFIAPRDEVAGGTWLGLNDAGVFVAITNRFLGPRDAARISRGALVVDALRGSSAREVHAAMRRIDPERYNGFHLVYTDGRDVLATISDGRELAQLTLGNGLSIVTERSFGAGAHGDDDKRRVERITAAWDRVTRSPFDVARATTLLTEHDERDPLGATCIHYDQFRYGTRSSMVLAISDGAKPQTNENAETASATRVQRESARMVWAEGPPCTTSFTEIDLRLSARSERSG
jgi:uncharacterized protein with NRDE domain